MTTESDSSEEIPLSEFLALRARIAKDGHRSFSDDEIADLIARVRRKERRAGEILIGIFDRFVFKILSRNKRKKASFANIDMDESMQEGRLSVLRAAEFYDPSKGRFSTYLAFWIMSSQREPNSGDPLIWIEPQKFGNGKYPKADPTEVAIARNVIDLDSPIGSDEGATIGESIATPEEDAESLLSRNGEHRDSMAIVKKELDKLSDRDREIVELRWLGNDERTLEDVGDRFGISRERVRQIEANFFFAVRKRFAGPWKTSSSL